ncbi:MAG: tRNA-dihydrouridine synthase, partial [Gammaproteobacteria bacterium]|nr:tRNA-dihydrouridine synthase [Gammaproteobacteria bacterium]
MKSTHRLSVAPMMERTDRFCRYFLRLITRHTLLYTEMITSAA